MDEQQPQEPTAQQGGGKSGLFQNINTVVAGITGLVIALGGLAAATKGVVWDKDDKTEQAAAAQAKPEAAAAPAPADPAATDTASEPEAGEPTLYEGDGVKLEWVGEEWQLTDGDTIYHYEDVFSPDENRYLAYDKANSAYLRWPVNGGMAEEGSADKQTWTNYAELEPAT